MPITYAKLNNGDWGVRSTTALSERQSITVTKKNGETKSETVDKVVWSGNGVWLATIRRSGASTSASSKPRRNSNRGTRTGCSCGSIEDTPRASDCASCRFENFDQ